MSIGYYLTTRGLNKDGELFVMNYLPESFHERITVVSSKANKSGIKKKYPLVNYLVSPDEINTAAKKRKWVIENAKHKKAFLLNDEMSVNVQVIQNKTPVYRNPKLFEKEFFKHIERLETLTENYVGVSLAQKLFIDASKDVIQNKIIGGWFHYNKKFATSKLELARLDYYEDIDYTLQALSQGYKVVSYTGLCYSARTNKPRRQHSDRTELIQIRDTKRIMDLHPGIVSEKQNIDLKTQDISINVKWAKAYKPKRKVLFICHGNVNRSAAAEIIASRYKKNFDFKSAGVKEGDAGRVTSKRMREALANIGIITEGIRSQNCTKSLCGWADDIYYMDNSNLQKLNARFSEFSHKFKSLAEVIGKDKIKDPGFSKAEVFTEVLEDIVNVLTKLYKRKTDDKIKRKRVR